MVESRFRRHSEEDVRALIREELKSPHVQDHLRELVRTQVYEARALWNQPGSAIDTPRRRPWWSSWIWWK